MGRFQKAKKSQAKLRLALIAVSGGGKTFTALELAKYLGGPVALIDTERSSASKYADLYEFDTLDLTNFSPESYISAINEAAAAGYKTLIIDSYSHAWSGAGGALEMADNASKRSGNRFTAWRDVTPAVNKLTDAILSAPMNIIATMRAKSEYVIEKDEKGRSVPKRVGLGAIQRENQEFEFDVVGEMTLDNDLIITKTRCPALTGKVFHKPGKEVADILVRWLSDGEPEAPKQAAAPVSSQSDNWTTRISECQSLQDLESLLTQIRQLPPDTQKSLVEPWRARKMELSSVATQ